MSKPIRIFVGTDERMGASDLALAHSIDKHRSGPVELHWMRAGTPPFDSWDIGRPPLRPYSGRGWATDFTCFRFAVPELANFKGKAIYVDTDMLFLADPYELFNTRTRKPWESAGSRTDVSVINCALFHRLEFWPSIADMRTSGHGIRDYTNLLHKHNYRGTAIDPQWDCLDGRGYHPTKTKLLHFTNMRTQPWEPYPDIFPYDQPHPHPAVCQLWFDCHKEAVERGAELSIK